MELLDDSVIMWKQGWELVFRPDELRGAARVIGIKKRIYRRFEKAVLSEGHRFTTGGAEYFIHRYTGGKWDGLYGVSVRDVDDVTPTRASIERKLSVYGRWLDGG